MSGGGWSGDKDISNTSFFKSNKVTTAEKDVRC